MVINKMNLDLLLLLLLVPLCIFTILVGLIAHVVIEYKCRKAISQ